MLQKLITKCDRYYKVRHLLRSVTEGYCKVWQVLQSVPDVRNCDRHLLQSVTDITKWDVTKNF